MVTSTNVLNPMETQCCRTFKCMLCFKYKMHVNLACNGDKIPHVIVFVESDRITSTGSELQCKVFRSCGENS